jgi:hypothetical protein
MRGVLQNRVVLTKMARWDPDKRWFGAMGITAEMRRKGLRPLLIARGGREPHGTQVLSTARAQYRTPYSQGSRRRSPCARGRCGVRRAVVRA